MNEETLDAAACAIREADALLVTAGAGMGVDSGLPDFRGPEGFWRAYPAYRHLGLRFEELANPRHFALDPELAWGFYGHRLGLYRETRPHQGFDVLLHWRARMTRGGCVFTSNIDGHFQRAGWPEDALVECHGSLEHLQCTRRCAVGIFPARDVRVEVAPETFHALHPLPTCPRCGALARPNVLMFDDLSWDDRRSSAQRERLRSFLDPLIAESARLVVVECGAGTAIPTVRRFGERLQRSGARLVRINLRESAGDAGTLSLASGAKDALLAIDERL